MLKETLLWILHCFRPDKEETLETPSKSRFVFNLCYISYLLSYFKPVGTEFDEGWIFDLVRGMSRDKKRAASWNV